MNNIIVVMSDTTIEGAALNATQNLANFTYRANIIAVCVLVFMAFGFLGYLVLSHNKNNRDENLKKNYNFEFYLFYYTTLFSITFFLVWIGALAVSSIKDYLAISIIVIIVIVFLVGFIALIPIIRQNEIYLDIKAYKNDPKLSSRFMYSLLILTFFIFLSYILCLIYVSIKNIHQNTILESVIYSVILAFIIAFFILILFIKKEKMKPA
ncbi:MAG: hypothetical protein KAS15_03750 [Nanoarchaeota archaeon]|nr:hypothetical protein [Nanoarchaeota archaeon]